MPEAAPVPEATAMAGASIQISNLEKRFGHVNAVRNFSVDISRGEFISVLGASGSGKTTVLRMIAGLEDPSGGHILIDGKDATELPPEARDIGLVFQDYALFPHMSVRENIGFPLQMRGRRKSDIAAEVETILALVGASQLADRKPSQLSGGQQQRVALARALVFKPKLLLLDEPLSALDKNLREHMKAEIKSLHRRTGVTVMYVTHDQSEALALSDRIIVMRDGSILDIDEPNRLYSVPSSSYLASFIGDANLIDGRIRSIDAETAVIDCPIGSVELPRSQVRLEAAMPHDKIRLVVRPENIVVGPPDTMTGLIRLRCRIDEMLYNGANTIYSLSGVEAPLVLAARCGQHQMGAFAPGDQVDVGLRIERSVIVLDDGESLR
ncbi:ABC-type Fe3+/spermidine/putrescine transport system ATPase subunit [Rhodoligotrophos appendicifer]|uniref:ABC transporter ATP-binding protein n=1 Tax=Rhodoligotrophos appendicifer TaxID=987056 RepID=UPI0011872D3D|nr:ABC transporter ATP-binding protein [Rhodoligotrophos appendicifer]